ncbi:acetylhydrolase [Colletotrichum plurivorum]|uniref:Acetylhydrolase n=1 Tax=Colletotrichum plurivorum TaxID=2175906 RepID=A0A8H6JNX1_9PEZI|nr:acetylhydrolase [Colletotrichum plurivorum]
MDLLSRHAKYKQRSYETSRDRHIPELRSHPDEPSVVLLGDSMIERMITTGLSSSFLPWPSAGMVSDDVIAQHNNNASAPVLRRLECVFNAGVGGDKIENLVYRLVGSTDVDRPIDSLLDLLRQRKVRVWVLHVGTNNLHPKRGLREKDLELLRLIVGALLEAGGRVLLVGLFQRRDVGDGLVGEANEGYRRIVREFGSSVEFVEPAEVEMDRCLQDHVHLNEEGYRVWGEVLMKRVVAAVDDSRDDS